MDNFPWIPCWECGSQDPWNLKFQISIMELQSRKTYMVELQAPQENNFQDTTFEVSCQSFLNYLTLSLPRISAWNSFYNQLLLIWNWLKEDCKKKSLTEEIVTHKVILTSTLSRPEQYLYTNIHNLYHTLKNTETTKYGKPNRKYWHHILYA